MSEEEKGKKKLYQHQTRGNNTTHATEEDRPRREKSKNIKESKNLFSSQFYTYTDNFFFYIYIYRYI